MLVPLKEIMTKTLTTVDPHTQVTKVAEIFNASRFHHIPVIEAGGILKGIISRSDFERIKSGMSLFRNPNVDSYNESLFQTLLCLDIMTKDVKELHPNDSITLAYEIFKQNKFRALPIVDKGILVGIVTPLDLLNYFFEAKIV